MSGTDLENQIEIFLRQFFLMNVLFPLFVTVSVIFFYVLGMGTSFLLGTTLLLLMGYNVIMARYGFFLWNDIRKKKQESKTPKGSAS
jgi:hypothetical protein